MKQKLSFYVTVKEESRYVVEANNEREAVKKIRNGEGKLLMVEREEYIEANDLPY